MTMSDCPCCLPPWSWTRPPDPIFCTHRKYTSLSGPSPYAWVRNHGIDLLNITTDPFDDAVIVVGAQSGAINLRKYDTNGNLLWSALNGTGGGAADGVAVDSARNIITQGASNLGTPSIFKRDKDGNLIWSKIQNYIAQGGGYAAAVDSSDNVIISASAKVEKYNSSGVYQWTYGSGTPFVLDCRGVACDSSNNVYVAASDSAKTGFTKLNSSGTLQWQYAHTNPAALGATVTCIAAKPDGSQILGGGSQSTYDNAGVRCLDASGSLLWGTNLGASRVEGCCFDAAGDAYAIQVDGTYSKIDNTGAILWQASHNALGRDIHVSAAGNLYLCGAPGSAS